MGFNAFPLFNRRKTGASVSEELYPNTKKVRDHMNLIEQNADRSVEYFEKEKKFKQQILSMFDARKNGAINFELITPEEIQDIKNFIAHAAKRISAGAISSPAYHEEIMKGKPGGVLDKLAPDVLIGHDSMHAMMAYLRTRGESLVPAYMKVENKKELFTYKNLEANLEEAYVNTFSNIGHIERISKNIRDEQGLSGEALVLATMETWEAGIRKNEGFDKADPNYLRDNRWPEFVDIVRNVLRNYEQAEADPNIAIHEFQRILAPLLKRLRESPGES